MTGDRAVQRGLPIEVPQLSRVVRAGLTAQIVPGWSTEAACASSSLHPDSWFGEPGEPRHRAARAVCVYCPVRRSCLAHALARDEQHGIWGGADPTDRAQLRLALTDGTPLSVVLGGPPPREAVA
jgi:hypothetical protein